MSLPNGGAFLEKRSLENWLSSSGFTREMVQETINLFELKNERDLMNLSDEKILNSNLLPWHMQELIKARNNNKTFHEKNDIKKRGTKCRPNPYLVNPL